MALMMKTQLKNQILASKVNSLRTDVNEASLKHDLFTFFKDLQDKILTALSEYWNDDFMVQGQIDLILAPIFESQKDYYDLLLKYNMKEFRKGKKTAERLVKIAKGDITGADKAEVDLNKGVKASFTKQKELFGTLQYSEDKLRNQTFIASESTMNRVDKDVNDILADGYNSGKGIAHVRDNITKRFTQLKTWESERIARTEIHSSQSMGIMNGYENLGVEYIEWDTAHDMRVRGMKKTDRANHVILDGEIIRFGDTFSNGLSYAGDRTGDIEEWINCRCGTLPFIMPDGYTAPAGQMQFKESDLVKVDVAPISEVVKPQTLTEPTTVPETKPQVTSKITKPKPTPKPKPTKIKTTNPTATPTQNNFDTIFKGEPKIYESSKFGGRPQTVYEYENIKLCFDKGDAVLTLDELKAHINSLPSVFTQTNAKQIHIRNHEGVRGIEGKYMGAGSRLELYKPQKGSPQTKEYILDNFNHEFAHSLDRKGTGYLYSSIDKYEKIFKADNKLYAVKGANGRMKIPKKFPTKYAHDSYFSFKKSRDKIKKKMIYVEDFAESSKLYLNKNTHAQFVKDFPNRAEYLEGIYGKPSFNVKTTEPAQIDSIVNDVLDDVLTDYGLSKPKTKPKKKPSQTKTKLKPVPQTEPTIQTKDITDKQLKQHLRKELPADFTDESIDYLVKKIRRRGPRKQEYGEIFDFKTGKPTSPEFKGGNNSVSFKEEGWIKNPKQMTIKEMEDALNNPSKYKKNYVNNSNSLATQHNHPSSGSRCFSGQDIKCTSHNKWEDYGFAISENEMWLCERKGSLNAIDADTIKRDMDKLWTKAKTKANREISSYDVNRDNRAELRFELTQENYSTFVLDYFKKNPQYGVKVKRIKYAEAVLV